MAFEEWWIGLVMSATTGVAFGAVAVVLLINAIKTKQVKNNPLGVATVILYLTCAGGHLVHSLQLAEVPLGAATAFGLAAQAEYSHWHTWALEITTAVAGIVYWMMRHRFPALVSGAAIYEDLRIRQRRALEIHDNIVQGLVRAKLALDMGMKREGDEAVDETLEKARHIITEMLGKEEITAGGLRRKAPGGAAHGV